jgi:hypothetical protein
MSNYTMVKFWETGNIGAGSGAVPGGWLIGDVNGDHKAEVIQLWSNNGRLGVEVYGWSNSEMVKIWETGDIGAGSGAVPDGWMIGDVNGDGKAEIIQPWSNNGRLGVEVYGWSNGALVKLWETEDIGAGSGAVPGGWLIGDVNGDHQAEIIQLWSNNGRLAVEVYGWSNNAMTKLWEIGDIGAGSGAVPRGWLIGDVNDDSKAEIIQLWSNNGRLGVEVYGWSNGAMVKLGETGDIGAGSGAVQGSWLIGDLNGDDKAEVIQLWSNDGRLAVEVYGWSNNAMTKLWETGDIGAGSGAVPGGWLLTDINADGRAELLQLWSNNGRLAVEVYGWSNNEMTKLWETGDIGAGSGAVSLLTGDINSDGLVEVLQLWDNNGRLGVELYSGVLEGAAVPRYLVLTIVYAPPGANGGRSQSSVEYSDGSTLGTKTSASQTFSTASSTSVGVSGGLLGGAGVQASFDFSQSTTDTQSLEIKKSKTFTITRPAPAIDGIDHDRMRFGCCSTR